jgi:cytochrome P450
MRPGSCRDSDLLGDHVLTSYQAVLDVLRGAEWSSDPVKARNAPPAAAAIPKSILILMDAAAHACLRGKLQPYFTRRALEPLRPLIRSIVQQALDGLEETFDVVRDFAEIIPLATMAEILGVDGEGARIFQAATPDLVKILEVDSTGPDLDRCLQAAVDVSLYLTPLIAYRRDHPDGTLLSHLNAMGLQIDEVLGVCLMLLAAGLDSTTHTLANSIHALIENPTQVDALRNHPRLAVEELVRLHGSIAMIKRNAVNDNTIGAQRVGSGEAVVLDLKSANRDCARYGAACEFDLSRGFMGHVGFGKGKHICLGANLARISLEEALLGFFDRYTDIKIVSDPVLRDSISVHAFDVLQVHASSSP